MIRGGIVSDEQIGPAVVVVVALGHAEAVVFVGIVNARLLRYFFECAIATIVVEKIGFALHAPGAALHGNAFELTKLGRAELRQVVHVHVNVARDEQIDIAVAVIVGPGSAGGKAAAAYTRLVGDVLKGAITLAAIERVSAVAGDEEVEIPVVVEIGDGDAHAPALAREPGLLRDVGELEIG